jgi:hypothetical protein
MMLPHRRAAEAGLQPEEAAPPRLKGFKSEEVVLDNGYHVSLRTKDGGTCILFAYGVDKIVTDINCSLD